jgi:hypothetical protein
VTNWGQSAVESGQRLPAADNHPIKSALVASGGPVQRCKKWLSRNPVERRQAASGSTRRRTAVTRAGERRRTRAVAAAAIASTVVPLWLLTASVLAGRAVATPVGPDALRIQIVGHQWWWEVRYPADPPSDTVITVNEIRRSAIC